MNHRILAVVVTYFPEKELLERDVAAFINDIDKILIWENTPEEKKYQYRYIEDSKVEYCGDGNNSISHGLNYAWRYANTYGYDYLLTMDQDSVFHNFAVFKEYVFTHSDQMMLFGPSINPQTIPNQPSVRKEESLITSGMLIQICILNTLGGYDEKLDIDGIDTDLCLRANQLGIDSYRIVHSGLQQRFGSPLIKYYKGMKQEITCYPPKRLKSIVAAHIYLIRKYPNMSPKMKKLIDNYFIKGKIKRILLFEDRKIQKIIAILLGIYKGKRMKI